MLQSLGRSPGYRTHDGQCQTILGFKPWILEMGDVQDVCVNASITEGLYHSGENVSQAGSQYSQYTVSGFPV